MSSIQTHIDIVEDFDLDLVDQLVVLSEKHDFLIFEDRKFGDIGEQITSHALPNHRPPFPSTQEIRSPCNILEASIE